MKSSELVPPIEHVLGRLAKGAVRLDQLFVELFAQPRLKLVHCRALFLMVSSEECPVEFDVESLRWVRHPATHPYGKRSTNPNKQKARLVTGGRSASWQTRVRSQRDLLGHSVNLCVLVQQAMGGEGHLARALVGHRLYCGMIPV
ncbi:MAG: hypothetical protein A2289_13570 [Deltaproteobacteria bacterium RIFOXYA12_FULL_58_15]|nr:MAG: hypothetical protein A2289_13570 [Deltaproteobacteria bacterium RIFOXYA12_FULL_58_15]OGR13422.1 MAG: hypothetical protein A2341_21180 [Deltaproteobacteria bacterium RIFOXYB12_FULL_58_9]